MLTLQQLKEREIGLLNSNNDRFIEYGKAFRDILKIAKRCSLPQLSEEVFISDMAQKYAEQEKHLYDVTKNENHRLHIKAASELFKKNFATADSIYELLEIYKRPLPFEEAKSILRETAIYPTIKPKTLMDVLELIEMNLKDN